MKDLYSPGDRKTYRFIVEEQQQAAFPQGPVHPVLSTFALAQAAEWCGRLFVLDICEPGEEGIGSSLQIQHLAPAALGAEVQIESTFQSLNGNELICSFVATSGGRRIATGSTGQKILPRSIIDRIISET